MANIFNRLWDNPLLACTGADLCDTLRTRGYKHLLNLSTIALPEKQKMIKKCFTKSELDFPFVPPNYSDPFYFCDENKMYAYNVENDPYYAGQCLFQVSTDNKQYEENQLIRSEDIKFHFYHEIILTNPPEPSVGTFIVYTGNNMPSVEAISEIEMSDNYPQIRLHSISGNTKTYLLEYSYAWSDNNNFFRIYNSDTNTYSTYQGNNPEINVHLAYIKGTHGEIGTYGTFNMKPNEWSQLEQI